MDSSGLRGGPLSFPNSATNVALQKGGRKVFPINLKAHKSRESFFLFPTAGSSLWPLRLVTVDFQL